MEDRYSLLLNSPKGLILGGVYDGHGGGDVAENASRIIPKEVVMHARGGVNIKEAFKKAFQTASREGQHLYIGSTALAFLIKGNTLVVANAGDCRMLLVEDNKIIQLTTDHRVTNQNESIRLLASGATISGNRVFHGEFGLNISRALGDLAMKAVGVTEEPEVGVFKLPRQYILIAATDGLWCYLKNDQVTKLVNFDLSAKEICQELIRFVKLVSLKYKYLDNTTLIVLKQNGLH
jgi:serine/threonine protein phosphatase PrpC